MVRITRYSPSELTRPLIERLQPLREAIHAEKSPEDPPPTPESLERQLQGIPEHMRLETWLATLPDGTIVGAATLVLFETEGQKHLADGKVEILPSHRRKGLGRRLYSLIGAYARDHGRQVLIGTSHGKQPIGTAFMSAIGAQAGLTEHVVRLNLSDVDRTLLATWATPIPGFSPVWWDNSCPDAWLDESVRLTSLFNDIPTGEIDLGDIRRTPEQLREEEAARARAGFTSWSLAVRDDVTGKLVGLTELLYRDDRPEKMKQGITGVEAAYRGRGLGRWLKATMLERLLTEKSAVRFIETENAEQNAPMRHINDALGFRLHDEITLWQVTLT